MEFGFSFGAECVSLHATQYKFKSSMTVQFISMQQNFRHGGSAKCNPRCVLWWIARQLTASATAAGHFDWGTMTLFSQCAPAVNIDSDCTHGAQRCQNATLQLFRPIIHGGPK